MFWEKIQLFLEKIQLLRKESVFSPPKFLINVLFFSHQLRFFIVTPLIDQKLRKQQQLIPYFFSKNVLLFSKNHSEICLFRKNLKTKKNHRFLETPEKTLGLREKTPEL